MLLGSIDHLRGDLERAASRYRRALALAPRDAAAHAALAVNLVQQGQPTTARAHFAAATAPTPRRRSPTCNGCRRSSRRGSSTRPGLRSRGRAARRPCRLRERRRGCRRVLRGSAGA
ncbi:tetratricopeptide repeat protein [Nannocystis pusilla]|uniref:tetratricopeptide repeat protein n=1 Tax=Nannocystis pusilla TaxID=889268 RepID=UPI003B7D5D36